MPLHNSDSPTTPLITISGDEDDQDASNESESLHDDDDSEQFDIQARRIATTRINNFFKSTFPKLRKAFTSGIKSGRYNPEIMDAAEEFKDAVVELEVILDPNSPDQAKLDTEVPRLIESAREAIKSVPMVEIMKVDVQGRTSNVRRETETLLSELQALTPPVTMWSRRESTSSLRACAAASRGGSQEEHDDDKDKTTCSVMPNKRNDDEPPLCYRCVIS